MVDCTTWKKRIWRKEKGSIPDNVTYLRGQYNTLSPFLPEVVTYTYETRMCVQQEQEQQLADAEIDHKKATIPREDQEWRTARAELPSQLLQPESSLL